MLLLAVVLFAGLWWRRRLLLRAVFDAVPPWRAACTGFVVLAVLGFALNDSGMTVPGIMLVVFLAAWVFLLVLTSPEPAVRDARIAPPTTERPEMIERPAVPTP
jgi:hypothetical protein